MFERKKQNMDKIKKSRFCEKVFKLSEENFETEIKHPSNERRYNNIVI